MRAIWKGNLELGRKRLPLKLYAAVEDSAVHFHLLHARDEVRVEQRIVNPANDEPVPKQAVKHGFALGGSRYVVIRDEELNATKPKPSRAIEIRACVSDDAIPPAYFERPYFLGPDGDTEAYFAFAEALRNRGRQCLVRFVMREKVYHAALRSDGERLSLVSLRARDEVLAAPEPKSAPKREANRKELELAEQLVATLEGDFDPSQFRSEYREHVHELVEQKAHGKPVKLPKRQPKKPAPTSLVSALTASVARARPHAQKERKSA